jgi:hypothetical protein
MLRSDIPGSYGSSIFKFLRDLPIAFHGGCTKLLSNNVEAFLFLPHPHQNLLLFVLLMIAILTGVRWNLNVVLICISSMAKDVGHFFICFLAVCTSSFENCLFNSFADLFSGLLILWEVNFFSSLYILKWLYTSWEAGGLVCLLHVDI